MKRTLFYIAIVAVAVYSCAKENNTIDTEKPQEEENVTPVNPGEYDPSEYLLGFGADLEKVDSKVSIDLDNGSLGFESGDHVLVSVPATETSAIYEYNGTNFVPTGEPIAVGSNVAYVYYPAAGYTVDNADVSFYLPDSYAKVGDLTDLGKKVPMAGIIPVGARDGEGYPQVTFKNLGSILRVRFNSSAAEGETITAVELSVTGANIYGGGKISWSGDTDAAVPSVADLDGGASLTLDVTDGHLTNSAYKEFYFFLPASGTLTKMSVKAIYGKTGGFEPYETISRTSEMTLARNQIYKVQKTLEGFFSGGDGSENYPYQIATADDFKAIATLANATAESDGNGYDATAGRTFFGSTGVHYEQTADIDFNNAALTSIGVYNATAADAIPFQGTYAGGGYMLGKFKVVGTQAASTGLFEYVDGATLKNIAIGQCLVTGENVTGILTGRCIGSTTIENCSHTGGGQVIGRNSVGFIAHIYGSTTVKNCSVSNLTVITADSGADANNQGGVVGFAGGASKIESCSTSGNIQFTGTISGVARGGIVGKFDSTGEVKECTNGAVISNGLVAQTGGIAGQLSNGTIVSCANTASVSGTSLVGGIVGYVGNTTNDGSATNITFITSCRNAANVTGTANCVAGIAGKLQNGAVMSACYAQGNVTTSTYDVGGLAGFIQINNNNATSRIYVYDCIANMNVSTSRTSGACRTGGAVGNITIGTTGQYVAIDNCGVLDVTITAGGEYVGGFAGWMTGDGTNSNRARIRNCYTLVSSVPGSANKGGFIGAVSNKAELRYCYFVADDSSDITTATTANYSKKTAAEIQSDATCTTFKGNNFSLNVGSTTYSSAKGWALTNGYPVPGALIALGSEYYK